MVQQEMSLTEILAATPDEHVIVTVTGPFGGCVETVVMRHGLQVTLFSLGNISDQGVLGSHIGEHSEIEQAQACAENAVSLATDAALEYGASDCVITRYAHGVAVDPSDAMPAPVLPVTPRPAFPTE